MVPPFNVQEDLIRRLVLTLMEDLGDFGDVTSQAIFPPGHVSTAEIVCKQPGVLCGAFLFEHVFAAYGADNVSTQLHKRDGEQVVPGDLITRFEGPTVVLLSCERTLLNFLQRLSGIATLTRRFVDASTHPVRLCDTRKTTPLWRDLEKYAVLCGGGTNHRMGLYDMVMIKDTHADGAGGLGPALEKVMALRGRVPIATEVRNLEEIQIALEFDVDLIMLDNMPVQDIRKGLELIGDRTETELTGNVSLETIGELSKLPVDRISIGKITHSAPALDFSMKVHLQKG